MYEVFTICYQSNHGYKCVIYGCKSGYKSNGNSVPPFHFPLQKVDLLAKWTKFVNRLDWSSTSNSVICANHFDQKFILNGKRKKLNWKFNPVPVKIIKKIELAL